MKIDPAVLREMWRLLCEHNPHEVCGALTTRSLSDPFTVLQVFANHAPDPTQQFWMSPIELVAFLQDHAGYPVMLWHSHPHSRWNLSPHDCKLMRQIQLPMAVVAVKPYPSVVVYDFHSTPTSRCIRMVETYHIPAEEPYAIR